MSFTETLETTTESLRLTNWRDDALNESLRGFDNDEGMDALLQAIRRLGDPCALYTLWVDRPQVMRFLREQAQACRSLIAGSVIHEENEEPSPYLGWYAVEWEGETVEVALAPGGRSCGVVCLAREEAVAWRFGRALEAFADRPAGRSLLYSGSWSSDPDLEREIGAVTWDDLILAPELMTQIRESIEGFFHHRDAYAALGFAWRRGILLIGPPGTGKTMVCKATASAFPQWPFLYVRDFREYCGEDSIRNVFERARKLSPCILAFEDIDGLVVEGNRTVFLNEMDGFRNNNGILIIASSNHPGKIDEALLKRPSRFDRVFHVGLPKAEERFRYCVRILSQSRLEERLSPAVNLEALARRVADRSEGFTPAYLKEVLVAAALQRAHEGDMSLDERFADACLRQVEELREHLRRLKDPEALADMQTESGPMGFRRS